MKMIEITPSANGAHNNQTYHGALPEGWAVIPIDMETENFPFGEVTVEEVDGVMTVSPVEGVDAGITEVIIDTDPAVEVRKTVFRLLAEKDIAIMGLENVSLTLEDIFTSLTMGREDK